jgi:hypothetical protein
MPQPPAGTYVLALTPADPAMPSVVARIELDTGHARIVEISVRPGSAGTPLPAELTDIDLPMLIQNAALMSAGRLPAGAPGSSATEAPSRSGAVPSPPDAEAETQEAQNREAQNQEAQNQEAQNQPKATDAGIDPRTPAHNQAPRTARSSRQRPGRGRNLTGIPSDLPKAYWRLGSAAKLAEHYDVPRQIAQGWIKSLRAGGALPDPWTSRPQRSEMASARPAALPPRSPRPAGPHRVSSSYVQKQS